MDYPFLTTGIYVDREYTGIVCNSDKHIISIYLLDLIKDTNQRRLFVQYGAEWWHETNHSLPIHMMLGSKWSIFKPYLKSFSLKEFQIISGPSVSLDSMISKKIKRKNINLSRR